MSGIAEVVHATTLVTNALIERKGARTALLATAGFRDVLEMARERRDDLYDLSVTRPDPLVPRHLRFDVGERTLADGTVERPLDEAFVARLGAELAARGIEAVAVCFLHSFANPAQRAGRAAGAERHRAAGRALQRGGAGDPRVRAHVDDGRERLRAGPRRPLPGRARPPPPQPCG